MVKGLLVAAVICLLVSLRRFHKRKKKRGTTLLLLSVLFAFLALAHAKISENLALHSTIHEERDIVEVIVTTDESGPLVRVRDLVMQRSYRWVPKGDQWRLKLGTLRLVGVCKKLGWSANYRLDRLEVSEGGKEGKGNKVHRRVKLHAEERGWDLWKRLRKIEERRPDLKAGLRQCVQADEVYSEAFGFEAGQRYRFAFRGDALVARKFSEAAE